ncbi:tRNA (adenine(58)-N(1))-methyltransferase, mitochondrial isoform X2 [Dendrobates tinctorius]|uniref:tRNA (adenine(58)-N(1))-methyltransferase, mitochondrial isoform X2 n=1 Tax=Dendrobates tinctorius TaxID=92724 RepID=UPI003CC98015
MSAVCAGRRLCSAALWCRAPSAGSARNLQTRRLGVQLQHCITLCSSSQEGHEAEGQPESPQPASPLGIRTWRRRSLSPLDRLSSIIPPEFISQEIRDLQSPEQLSTAGPPSSSQDHPEQDIASILMMMDVSPGDVILEAGSGSGALSLFLSRAVGPAGCVHSIELRSDHHQVSKRNFSKWKTAWEIRSRRSWPDNVNFINKDIRDAMSDIRSVGFDAVALDMLNPQVALPAIIGNLKQGGVCAVYITNITQVIDLLEGIRSCELPLLCEKVMEVSITDWLVAPSLRKDGSFSKRVDPLWNWTSESQTPEKGDEDNRRTDDGDYVSQSHSFGQVPYIARPMPWQIGHTAFLVKLRKFKAAAEQTEPGGTT